MADPSRFELVRMRFAIGVVVIAVAAFACGELIRPSRRDLAVFVLCATPHFEGRVRAPEE